MQLLFSISILLAPIILAVQPMSQVAIANHNWIADLKYYQRNNGNPKRPFNTFMCYKISYHDSMKPYLRSVTGNNPASSSLAKAFAESWKQEDADFKQQYKDIAQIVLQNHQRLYPNHKFKNTKRKLKKLETDAPHEVITMLEWEALGQNLKH